MKRLTAMLVLVGLAFAGGMLIGPRLLSGSADRTVSKSPRDTSPPGGAGPSRDEGDSLVAADSIHALGRVEPEGGLYPVGVPAGARVLQFLVTQGQAVEGGDELAKIEGYAERQGQIKLIETELAEADEQLKAEDDHVAVLEREAGLEKEMIRACEPLEREAQQANINLLTEKLKGSEKDYDDLAALHRDRRASVSDQELQRQWLLVLQDRTALNAAKVDFEKYKRGQELRLRKVDLALQKGKSASQQVRLAVHKKSLTQQLALAREQLKQTVIQAPRAGRVLMLLAKPGEVPGPKPILQLGDTRRMYVIAEVDEDQIPLVKEGQKATIHYHGLKPRTYTGVVESQALMVKKNDLLGLDPAASAYARVVEVKIKVDEPCDDLRDLTNAQVRVEIHTTNPATTNDPVKTAPR